MRDLKHYPMSIQLYDKVLQINDENADAYLGKGVTYTHMKNY